MTESPLSPPPVSTLALPRAFYVSLAATALFAFGLTILVPIIPLYVTDELGMAERWIGTSTLAVAFVAVASRIPAGALSDRIGRRKIMIVGAYLGLAAAGLYLVSQHFAVFLVARTLTGASLALFTTTSKALSADLSPPRRRGEALGMNNAAFSLATVASPLLSEGLKNAVGFQAVFALSGALNVLALLITYSLPRTRPEVVSSLGARRDTLSALHERGTWASLLLMAGLGGVLALMFTFYPFFSERKDLFADAPGVLSSVSMGLGLSIWAFMNTVIEPVAGRLSDRIGRLRVAAPGLVCAVLGVLALSQASGTLPTYLAIVLLASGFAAVSSAANSISQDAVAPTLRGMSAAMIYTSFDLSVGLNAQVLSALIDGTDFGAFFAALMVVVIGFGVAGLALSTRLVAYEKRLPAPETMPSAD